MWHRVLAGPALEHSVFMDALPTLIPAFFFCVAYDFYGLQLI